MTASGPGANRGIPVHILTGFLGSGKTTLLRHLLSDPALNDTAVVINEFGEVGLDHLLVREVAEDVVLLGSGCLCCTVRDDLVSTLANLSALAAEGEIPGFARLVVETTGLADPVPIAEAVLSERRLTARYRLGRIVTTVDALCGSATLDAHPAATIQAAVADRIVVTKVDMADEAELIDLEGRLAGLNGSAERLRSRRGAMPSSDRLFGADAEERTRLLPATAIGTREPHGGRHHGIATFSVAFDQRVRWADFVDWLDLLLTARGSAILRVKGLLATESDDRPTVVQGVRNVVYPPETLELDAWPERPSRSWLVFIARDLTRSAIETSLRESLGVVPVPAVDAPPGRKA